MQPVLKNKSDSSYAQPLLTLGVDLDAVAHNYLLLSGKMKTGADCGAVVKADAYGLGAPEIARALYARNCRHFFVATFDEGLLLRRALPKDALLYILHGPHGAEGADFISNDLIPVLNTLDDIAYWSQQGQRPSKQGQRPKALLHLDTGMNRLGLTEKEAHVAAEKDLLTALDLRYVLSHLACADDPAHPKNREQLDLFKKLAAAFGKPLRLSLANSGGIFLGEDYHFDLARPGAALYGLNPGPGPNPMRNVVTLKARILQQREITQKGTVGYGASRAVEPPAKLAAINIGYADGYLRHFSDHGTVVINGEKCPVAGRVSMDLIVADITHLKTPPGDWAEIIGPAHPADAAAAEAGTIGYEILTSLGKACKRTYIAS